MASTDEVQDDITNVSNVSNVNELLCFVQQRSKVMAVDHLIELCASFYNSEEVKTAVSINVVNRAGTKKSVTRKTKPVERWEGDKSEVNIGVYEEKC